MPATEFSADILTAMGFPCHPYDGIFRFTSDNIPNAAIQAAVQGLPIDPATFRILNLMNQAALVAACSNQQLKDLNKFQRQLVQKERVKKYTGQQNPPEDSLDGIALDALADALQEALDEGETTVIKASRFAGWLAERATVQAEYPYPPDVPD